jgi:molecular chaperone DnaK
MANIVGIDLGTSTTVVARFNDIGLAESTNNIDGDQLTASVVHIEPDGVVTSGKEAKKLVGLGHENVFSEFKREMGGGQTWQVNGRTITPEDLSSYLLKQVMSDYVQQFGQPDTTVISWPANFTDRQKVATKEAARRAGLNVQHFINEPTAAALYYTLSLKLNGTFLVYDMGGGTFDVTVVEVKGFDVRVIFSEGVARLGGADMDAAMLGIIGKKFAQQTGATFDRVDCNLSQLDIESPKHSLSTRDSTDIRPISQTHGPVKMTITRAEFEEAIRPLIQQAEKSCTDMLSANNIDRSSLREVFMVGGTSRIPALQDSVQQLFGRKPIIREPDHAVARGVAIYAALKTDASKLTQLQRNAVGAVKVIDITPHYFGLALHEPYSNSVWFNRVLIEKGLPVPYSIIKRFHTSPGENKTGIKLIITQSARSERDISKVKILHDKHIAIDPRGHEGEQIDVTFSYDANGIMECLLHEISTGKMTQLNLQAD